MGIKIAPIHELQKNTTQKHALPPIMSNRIMDSNSSAKSIKESITNDRHIPGSLTPIYLNNSFDEFKVDALSISFEKIEQVPEINSTNIKKINRIAFPINARKILLPDEAERPFFAALDSGFSKMASPYVQIMKDNGSFSMILADPLNSIPSVDDKPVLIPVSNILKGNTNSSLEFFQLLNTSQLSTLLLYLARIGDADSVKYLCRTALININITDDSGRSPLVYAAIGGHKEIMILLLESGASVDAIDHGGRTALFHAAYYAMCDSISILLRYGADITHRDYYGKNVLHYCIFCDRAKITRILMVALLRSRILSWFSDHNWELILETVDESGLSPVMLAAYSGQLAHLKTMLSFNFNSVNVKDRNGFSLLHFSTNNSHLRVSKYLLKKNKKLAYEMSNSGCRPIHLACRKGNYALLELFLRVDQGLLNAQDSRKRTPLHYASAYGNVACIRILLKYGADIDFKDDDGLAALHFATIGNFLDCVQLLIKEGALIESEDMKGRNPIIWAFMQGHLDIAKALFPLLSNQNTISDSAKRTPLHIACMIGNHASCSFLLQNDLDIDAKDNQGMTPLFICMIMGWIDILKDLLTNGANISEQDILGRTALHWGIITNSLECVQILLDLPECLKKLPDYRGNEPVHEAANIGNDDLLDKLIQMGCDPSVANDDGLTPLHLCCAVGSVLSCKLLLNNAVPFNALDFSNNRKTPLDFANERRHNACSELLRLYGCMTGHEIRNLAARAIQYSWDKYKIKKRTRNSPLYRNQVKIRDKLWALAAIKIQSWFRGIMQRRKYRKQFALAKIEMAERNEMAIAMQALEQAKIIREEAEQEKAKALEGLKIAKERTKELQSLSKTYNSADSKMYNKKYISLRNTAALLIQRNWRKYSNQKKTKKSITLKVDRAQIIGSNSTKSVIDDHNDKNSNAEKLKFIYRQTTGSKLNTLPKFSAPSSPQNGSIQFETGNFNKVFKSKVALAGRDPLNIKQDIPKRSELPTLLKPIARNVGKSMDLGARAIASQVKRLSFDHGDMKRIAMDYHNLVTQVNDDNTKEFKDPHATSTSTTADSTQNSGNIFTDSIPKGYDEINFHSIVRGTSKRKI